MSWGYDDPEQRDINEEMRQMKAQIRDLAPHIKDNKHLRKILKDADPRLREEVYLTIKPHLTFKPLSYILLKP